MLNSRVMGTIAAALAVVLGGAASAMAGTVDVTKGNGDFIAGSGIPADNFTGDTNPASGESVWLKARGRDSGEALSVVGTTYFLQQGAAASSPSNPWWNFDFQLTPGAGATLATDYRMVLEFDKDPTAGTNYVVFDANILGATGWSVFSADGYFTNPGSGGWSNDTTPYVYSQSWRPNFSFIDPVFDKDAAGTYEIRLSAYSADGRTLLAQTAITAQVGAVAVPLPASSLMGFGLLGGIGAVFQLRRRRKSVVA